MIDRCPHCGADLREPESIEIRAHAIVDITGKISEEGSFVTEYTEVDETIQEHWVHCSQCGEDLVL